MENFQNNMGPQAWPTFPVVNTEDDRNSAPVWFEIYGMPGCGKSSSKRWFQSLREPTKELIDIGENLISEKELQKSFSTPQKHAYFTQRKILENYSKDLDQIGLLIMPDDIVFEHVPLGLISCFNSALYFYNYFPAEGMKDLQILEQTIKRKRAEAQKHFRVKRLVVDIDHETCMTNLQERNPSVYKLSFSKFERHFSQVMKLTNVLLKTMVSNLEDGRKISYEPGKLFDGVLRDMYLNCSGSENHGIDVVDGQTANASAKGLIKLM